MPAEKSLAPIGHLPGVSSTFRIEAIRSVIAIIAFIIVYFLLFILDLCLVALCFYLAFLLISARIAWLPLIAAIGLVGCGVMVFVFLIKFLFSSSNADENDCIEVTESDQPVLLESIRSLSKQIGTAMPKKVFLSSEVNASVSYSSSFWSTFLPVKKNLRIGMGLVNSLNVSELEAVIAHEFGHFSQRSMKVGSWVYQVNKIIYDMLGNNTGFNKSLMKWAEASGIFMFFSKITIWIIKGIQWILHQMYKVVNKNYRSLSRQMEFHADLVPRLPVGVIIWFMPCYAWISETLRLIKQSMPAIRPGS